MELSRYLSRDEEPKDPAFHYGSGEPSSSWIGGNSSVFRGNVRSSQPFGSPPLGLGYHNENLNWTSETIGASSAFTETCPDGIAPRYEIHVHNVPVQTPLTNACVVLADFVSKIAISHPCTVLRRQCQVHQSANSLHLTPFTLAPVVCNVISNIGFQTLWKGAVASGVLWGLSSATEFVIAEFFGLPRTVIRQGSTKKFWRHILLKACSYFVMTPFIVSSFIETVRSETGLSRDDIRVMDVLTNGVNRLRFDFIKRDSSKRFSLFYLALPTVAHQTGHYLIAHITYGWTYQLARRYVNKKPALERTAFHHYLPDLFAMMSSQVLADFICYPFETVLHRLYIQGTRTLIDNLDTGVSAISITAKYTGFVDCLQRILKRETAWALYAGVGALALQYLLNFSLLRLMRTAFDYGMHALGDNQGVTAFVPPHNMPPQTFDPSLNAQSSSFVSSLAPPVPTEYPSFGQTSTTLGRHTPPERFPSIDYPFNASANYSFRSSFG